MNTMALLFLVVFVAIMFGIGIIFAKRNRDSDDYFLGGRDTPLFLIVASLLASEIGGGVMLGSVGYGYSKGWGALWYLAPMAIGLVLFGILMAKRLKADGDNYGYVSMFQWLSGRFDDKKDIRLVGAIVMLTGFVGSLASQFVAMGTALTTILSVDKLWGLFAGGIIVIIYASLGGLLSVMWTDLLQAAVFLFGMLIFLPMLLTKPEVGGMSGLFSHLSRSYPNALTSGTLDWRIGMLVTMMVAPFVRQYYYQRMFASKSQKIARNSMFFQAVLLSLIAVWTVLVGAAVNMLNPGLNNAESAMPWALNELFPPVIAAIVLSAIVACIMSTADTFINAAALTFVKDIYGIAFGKKADKKTELKVARISSFVIGILALIIAASSASVMSAIQKAWSILGGGLFCPMVVSYFWKKSSHMGVLLSMIFGFAATLYATLFTGINAIFIGIPVSLVVLILGSMIFKNEVAES